MKRIVTKSILIVISMIYFGSQEASPLRKVGDYVIQIARRSPAARKADNPILRQIYMAFCNVKKISRGELPDDITGGKYKNFDVRWWKNDKAINYGQLNVSDKGLRTKQEYVKDEENNITKIKYTWTNMGPE